MTVERFDPKTMRTYWWNDDGTIGYERSRREGLGLIFIPLMLLTFIAGLLIGVKVDKERPLANDPGFVNIEGHGGEILVVGPDGSTVQWTTEAQLHREASHG